MIAAFCVSPIPSIRMNTGINARNGIGLKSPNSPAKILSTGFHNPRSIPKTTPNTIPIRKPCPTLKKLMERFFHNFPVLTRLCNVTASRHILKCKKPHKSAYFIGLMERNAFHNAIFFCTF